MINDYATYPLFVQVHGVQVSLSDESATRSTKDWFESDRKEKQHTEGQLREVSWLFYCSGENLPGLGHFR